MSVIQHVDRVIRHIFVRDQRRIAFVGQHRAATPIVEHPVGAAQTDERSIMTAAAAALVK